MSHWSPHRKYEHVFAGYNFRMEGLQGGFLAVKLPYLDQGNENRRKAAATYGRLLADSAVVTPEAMPDARHIYHLYVIQSDDREGLKQRLGEQGIETGLLQVLERMRKSSSRSVWPARRPAAARS